VFPLQLTPQVVIAGGKMQAPVLSHPVAPQTGSVVSQATVQQLPVPLTPHTPD
jgi:hypothetical protein